MDIRLHDIEQLDIQSCYDLGSRLKEAGEFNGAEHCFRRIVTVAPELPDPQHALGVVLQIQGRLEEAILHYQAAIAIDPAFTKAHYNLADALSKCGRYQQAIESASAALQNDQSYADAHWLLGMLLLQQGDFPYGWREYEWRWRSPKFNSRIPELGRPLWDGASLSGKTLLIHMEQGRGDMIQFIRFAPLAAASSGRVVVCAVRELVSLLSTVEGVSEAVDRNGLLPAFDTHIPVQSLPRVLGITLETVPNDVPYLCTDPIKVAEWGRILQNDGLLRVGLVWQGGASHLDDHNRSCALQEFTKLCDLPGVTFYSLQIGAGVEQLAECAAFMQVVDLTGHIHDFSDTAAFMANLDLIITVDTAAAHLAGALGKPVWTLLPYLSEWRWLLNRDDSPWYPTMRLFRQATPGDWSGLMDRVRQKLALAAADFHNRKGIDLFQVGRVSEAEQAFSLAVRIDGSHAEAHCNLGTSQDALQKYEEAVDSYSLAIALRPDYMQAFFNMGNTCRSLGNRDAACSCYKRALALVPDFVPAMLCLGEIHKELHQFQQAQRYFSDVIYNEPSNIVAYLRLAECCKAQEKLNEAVEFCRQALKIDPEHVGTLNILGVIYHLLGQLEKSEACFRKALILIPDDITLLNNWGALLHEMTRTGEAITVYRRVLDIDPNCAEGHWNLSLALLSRGEYAEGWREYEWRFNKPQPVPQRFFHQPLWDGSPLYGKTILLHCEQGFGDTIQFVRYAPLLIQRGGTVLIECQSPVLKRLLSSLDKGVQVVSAGEQLPHFDCHLPLMSLPYLLKTTLDTVPASIPYLHADPVGIDDWRHRLGTSGKFKVGLVWYARQAQVLSRSRLCPLENFAPLAAIPNTEFYSLQIGEGAEQLSDHGSYIHDLTANIRDFADTAAFIANLDLVISIDTAVAHLSGALGVRTWVLLPYCSEWRWLEHRRDCPWYPSMRLMRQASAGDWSTVFSRVSLMLNELANQGVLSSTTTAPPSQSIDLYSRPPLRIGIAWSCNRSNTATSNRICPLSALLPLFDTPYIRFYSLQVGTDETEILAAPGLIDLTDQIHDFEDTAALMANLDLIISVDTSVVHLAAASGRPTWVLLPHVADWRWLQYRLDSPWYPGVQLFRQADFGDWDSVIREVGRRLIQLTGSRLDSGHGNGRLGTMANTTGYRASLDETLERYRRAFENNPDDPEANLDLGAALALLGKFNEAASCFRKVIALEPGHASGHLNLAYSLMAQGDYDEGLLHHEWRLSKLLPGQLPPWPMLCRDNFRSHNPDTSLLVHSEQGFGDTIMFARFLPMLADAGYRVVVCCQPTLASLIASVRGVSQVVQHGELLPKCDLQVLQLTIPWLLSTTLSTLPVDIPYIFPQISRVQEWKTKVDSGHNVANKKY